ncbi:MAG: hypothetical protein Q8N31_17775 [Reyranella sp.]|nr:hypothetical protein [Reyranella sp.]MDP3161866.1 hypothetical protein [Reyranella sp.]
MFSRIAAVSVLIAASLPTTPTFAQAPSPDSWIEDARTGCRIRNPAPQPRESVTWSGACLSGIAEGTGILQWFDDDRPTDRYEGELRDGWENGRGIATSTVIADRYDGDWRDGWRHGRGVYDFTNGDRYEGDWFEGLRTGQGTMVWADGARYEGRVAGQQAQRPGHLCRCRRRHLLGELVPGMFPGWQPQARRHRDGAGLRLRIGPLSGPLFAGMGLRVT